MKLILAVLLLAGNAAFAGGTAGTVLKNQVLKMGSCTGKNDIQGVDVNFTSEKKEVRGQKASVLAMYIPNDAVDYMSAFTTNDEYAYTVPGEEAGKELGSLVQYTPWKVEGKQVLVYVNGNWLSMIIGFKSKTCWFN